MEYKTLDNFKENSGNYITIRPEFSNGQFGKSNDAINRIVHNTENRSSLSRKLQKKSDEVSGFKGKRVLLRADLNSEVIKGKVIEGKRIAESAKTIKELQRKGARVVVVAHQGRAGEEDFISLEQHSRLLGKYVKIKFVKDILGVKVFQEVEGLNEGEAVLLENIRFEKDEMNPSLENKLCKAFKGKFDIFINDAFSVCHRKQTSIVCFPKMFDSGIGRLMQKEIESLEKLNLKGALFILGGAKVEEPVMLLKKGRKVLSGGIFSLLCLIASGVDLGAENKILKDEMKYLGKIRKHLGSINLPSDLAVDFGGKRVELRIDEFPSEYKVLDIGERTIEEYIKEIKKARAIFLKGPVGHIGVPGFEKGTLEILKAIADARAFSVLAGGHTTTFLGKIGINKNKFGYVSLSGGATLEFVAGKKLPGLEALRRKR